MTSLFLRVLCSAFVIILTMGFVFAEDTQPKQRRVYRISDAETFASIRAILEQPEDQIDLLKTKLTVDAGIFPVFDAEQITTQIDAMAAEIRGGTPRNRSSNEKLVALRTYLYHPGAWNDQNPFQYDLVDPYGRIIRNKLLPIYLKTHQGNCVSMPILFMLLGQRIGLDVTLASSPNHIFVKYRDDTGKWFNLETTSGAGFARDVWIREQMPMTDRALANGVYMQPLSKKEMVALMATTLIESYSERDNHSSLIPLGNLLLKYHPKNVAVMMYMADSHMMEAQRVRTGFYSPTPRREDFEIANELEKTARFWENRAMELGWQKPMNKVQAPLKQLF